MIKEYLIENPGIELDKCKIYLSERYDIAGTLFFQKLDNVWKFSKDFDTTEKDYDCMKMIKKDEELSELLDFLPKSHEYRVIFQIPEEHDADIYPHIEEGRVCVKIINEYFSDKIVEPTFNMDKNMLELTDISTPEQLDKALSNLDCISTSLNGIDIYDYDNGIIHDFIAPSAVHRNNILFNSGNYSIFEIIKMTQAGIFLDVYPGWKANFDYVQNNVLKTVFDYLLRAMDINKDTSQYIENIRNLDDKIVEWFRVSLEATNESRQSKSIILWRKLIELDLDYSHIFSAYEELK